MSTFKAELYKICKDAATEFPGWSFASGQFKNKSLKHSELIVDPGFGFEHGATPLQPSVTINNKRSAKLSKYIIGIERSTSIVNFQVIAHMLTYTPENLKLGCWIVQDKRAFLAAAQTTNAVAERTLDITGAGPILVGMMKDGISFIEKHYDLSNEENFLKGLPAKYTTRHVNSPYDQMEKQKGVMMCIVHILLGDFDFFECYRNENFKTIFPKRTDELDKIAAALPVLKKRYAETGSVI